MKTRIISGLFGLGSIMGVTIASAASVQLTPSNQSVTLGDAAVTVSLRGAGFTETTVGGGVQLNYDASILTLTSGLGNNSAVAGSIAASANSNGFEITSASSCGVGCVDMSFSSFSNSFSAGFAIADLVFTAIAVTPGTPLTLAAGIIDPVWYDASFAALASQPDYTNGASVTVVDNAVVPVPAAVWLFGSGLLGLVGVARRRAA